MSDEQTIGTAFETPIDTKYEFLAWPVNGDPVDDQSFTEDEALVFRAKDNALPATLRFYREECERLGAPKEQLCGIDLLIMRVEKWREQNPDRCKVPD